MTSQVEQDRWVPVESIQGDGHLVRFDFVQTDLAGVTTARDMSAYTFTAQIRRRPGASGIVTTLDVDDSSSVDGVVTFELPVVSSAELRVMEYRWDAQWLLAGRPLTFATGPWTVVGQVTQ